jgi:hypothetical protein
VARRTVTTARAGLPAQQRADAADLAAQPQYSHNTAIAIGNGAQAGAGLGNNNFASAVGADSRAIAAGGDNNKALVFGDRSQAVAGQGGVVATSPTPYLTSDLAVSRSQSNNNNIAIVRGNDSKAVAGVATATRTSRAPCSSANGPSITTCTPSWASSAYTTAPRPPVMRHAR